MTKISDVTHKSPDSSTEDSEEKRLKKFARHMLKTSIFLGTFHEKRFVAPLNSYRNVIKVADDEIEIIENLIAVKKRCDNFYPSHTWIGITGPTTIGAPAGYNVWVTLDEEVFGSFFYKIKNVEFTDKEIQLKLETVRPVSDDRTPNLSASSRDDSATDSQFLSITGSYCKDALRSFFTQVLTFNNVKEATIFICLLLSTAVTFLVHAVKYLMEFVLKFLNEFSGIIKVCTPTAVAFIRFCSQTVSGFYMLIAVLWRDRHSPPQQNVYMLTPGVQNYQTRGLPAPLGPFGGNDPYAYRRPARITPLN